MCAGMILLLEQIMGQLFYRQNISTIQTNHFIKAPGSLCVKGFHSEATLVCRYTGMSCLLTMFEVI